MDDIGAVCAQNFEWVANGLCSHRDVCSTCVVRLRYLCNNPRCSIFNTPTPLIFVTRALGEYARMISDFSILPTNPNLGRVGSYWYLEHLDAYFDDSDHYRMIKAMCSCLSCNVCDKIDHSNCRPKAAHDMFKSLVQLESHLFHKHRLFMCPLCLERKKVFISEQKLYTRAQLNKQVDTGDFEADGGDLFERGGFIGHHKCEFCKKAFYGNSELHCWKNDF